MTYRFLSFITTSGAALVFLFIGLLFTPHTVLAGNASINVSPTTLFAGGQVTVTWSSSDTFRCVGTGFSTGGATNGSRTVTVPSAGTRTYSIACYDQTPSCSLKLKSTSSRPGGGFSGNSSTCSNINYSPNGSCYPKWGTCQTTSQSGGTFVPGEGFIGGSTIIQNYRCEGGCSTVTASKSITVNTPPPPPQPSATLTASPSTFTPGSSVTLSWSSQRATSCRGSGFSTNGATRGSVTVTPSGNTTYRITCDSEVRSSVPGTYQLAERDYTDYWCPVSTSVFNRTYSVFPNCPTNSVTTYNRNNSEGGPRRVQNGDPTGMPCTGSEVCKLNSNNSCVVQTEIYRCNGGSRPNTIRDSLTISANNVPAVPIIVGPTNGVPGVAYSFTFQAIDLDSDNVRYRIDWNPNSGIDENSSYSSSNWLYSTTRSWASPGTYTFRARTQDSNSAQSGYNTHTITIGNPTPECADGIDNDGDGLTDLDDFACSDGDDDNEGDDPQCSDGIDNDDDGRTDTDDYGCSSGGDGSESPNPQCSDGIDNNGNGKIDHPADPACTSPTDDNEEVLPEASISLTANPSLTQEGSTVSLDWSASDVESDSCSLSGTNGDVWSLSGSSGSQTSSTLTNETIFTLQCTDLEEDPVATSVTVKLVPQFGEI